MGGRGTVSVTANSAVDTSYWLNHRPGNPIKYPDEVSTVDNIVSKGLFPDDVLSHPEYYADGYTQEAQESIRILRSLQGRPDAEVTVYRGAPSSTLNTGDWVTLSKEYASIYAAGGDYADNPNSRVYSYKVKASELSWDGDSFNEFGYWGKQLNNKKK